MSGGLYTSPPHPPYLPYLPYLQFLLLRFIFYLCSHIDISLTLTPFSFCLHPVCQRNILIMWIQAPRRYLIHLKCAPFLHNLRRLCQVQNTGSRCIYSTQYFKLGLPSPWRIFNSFSGPFLAHIWVTRPSTASVSGALKGLAKLCTRRRQGMTSRTETVRLESKTTLHQNELIPPRNTCCF